jgi:gamma-glutamyltranspeptidase/glutathione hydrolase
VPVKQAEWIDSSRYIDAGYATGHQPALGVNGMVTTPHAWATLAGLDVLRKGGNAVDAAIAVSATLMVVAPHQGSPGGDAFWLIRPAGGPTVALNATGRSPIAASIEELAAQGHQRIPAYTAYAVTVPGVVDGWFQAHRRYGTVDLPRLLAPAITAAEEGVPITPYLARRFHAADEVLRSRPESARIYRPNGRRVQVGDRLRQPDLGRTLQLLANDPSSLYRGTLAERIADAVRAEGGWLALDDLQRHTSDWLEPVGGRYQSWTIEEIPPSSQGVIALVALAIAETSSPVSTKLARLHTFIEAAKIGMVIRKEIGDPASMRLDVVQLLEPGLISRLASLILSKKVNLRSEINQALDQLGLISTLPVADQGYGDTAHFAIVDADGLAVSMIQSLYLGFGSGIVVPGTGITMQNRGYGFELTPGRVNSFAPNKRPLHTLAPALARIGEQTVALFGAMGGDAQPQLHMQMVQGLLDDQLDPAHVASRPRWFARESAKGFELLVDSRLRLAKGLERLGHKIVPVRSFDEDMGHEQIIAIDHKRGVLFGAADPGSDGLALGH